MMPKVLWETTLNPKTRRLLRVEVTDSVCYRFRRKNRVSTYPSMNLKGANPVL